MQPVTFLDGRVTLISGDCLDVLAGLPENGVDSVVCDPPYHLTSIVKRFGGENAAPAQYGKDGAYARATAGFMGQKWDGGDVAFRPETWAAVLRVMKPGAHLLAFSGTRTYHRMVCAIEDAGFEIRDQIAWVYGCLSEDTEILVDGRWEHYSKATTSRLALCYDVGHDEFSWQPIERQVTYDYDEPAFRIQSEHTDQIVSRNHRCIVDRGNGWEFVVAEEAARQSEIRVPVVEDVRGLFEAVPCFEPLSGRPEQDVFARLLEGGSLKGEHGQTEAYRRPAGLGHRVCGLREEGLEAERLAAEGGSADLLVRVQRETQGAHANASFAQGALGLDAGLDGVIPRQDDRRGQPGMEGRRHIFSQTRELQADQVCALSAAVHADGAERRLCDGTSPFRGASSRALPDPRGGGSPRQPRPAGQSVGKPGTVRVEQGSQTLRVARFAVADLARIEPVPYVGKVWCVRVPTGAFVARRNGKVFITGNSGFPKSHDVSKGIDRMAGAEREVVGRSNRVIGNAPSRTEFVGTCTFGETAEGREASKWITAPATEAARQWQGFGSALKPALEPIVLARKPLTGTIAGNVLRWGTGALNIDGCRVGTDGGTAGAGAGAGAIVFSDGLNGTFGKPVPGLGRWPANLIHDGSEEVLAAFPETAPSSIGKPRGAASGDSWGMTQTGAEYADSGSAARFFYSSKADAEDRLGSKHPTVKPVSLIRYLAKLVTPPNGVILDCFAGTGTLGEAAYYEGFRAILIEREEEYQRDIARRMNLVLAGPEERSRETVKAAGKTESDPGPLFSVGSA